MKLPRDLSGTDLARALARLGYSVTRQTGSHIRLTTQEGGEHHVSVPAHKTLPLGTLRAILKEVGRHWNLSSDEPCEPAIRSLSIEAFDRAEPSLRPAVP